MYKPIQIILIFLLTSILFPLVNIGQSCNADGGIITTTDNTIFCVGDGKDDIVEFNLINNVGSNSIWLITDEKQNILSRLQGQPLGFDAVNDGVVLVYHMSYEDDAKGFNIGENIQNIQGCHDLSNPVSIVNNLVKGGNIMDNNSRTSRSICLSNPNDGIIDLNIFDEFGDHSSWVITDENNNILATPTKLPFDLSTAIPGVCLIYHIGHNELTGLEVGNNLSELAGCYALSNSYTVNRIEGETEAGQISTSDNLSICSGDNLPDLISVIIAGSNGGQSTFVVTDPEGRILSLENNATIDLEGQSGNLLMIRNLQYLTGLKGLQIGQYINDLQGCHDLSNTISVTVNNVDGGTLSGGINQTSFHYCVDDGRPDALTLSLSNRIGENSTIIVTDEKDTIKAFPSSLNFNFEGNTPGIIKIYHASHNENLTELKEGQILNNVSGCFDLSNPVIIHKYNGETNAGVISTLDNTIFCAGDTGEDIVNVIVNNQANNKGAFVVTNNDGKIMQVSSDPSLDFTNSGGGVSYIYYLDYIDGLANLKIGNNLSDLSGCYDLSNTIQIMRSGVNGGILELIDGTTSTTECIVQSSIVSLSVLLNNTEGINQNFLLTSTDDLILDTFAYPTIDFDNYSKDQYKLYHLSSLDNLTGLEIGQDMSLMDGCFDVSNPIQITIQNTVTTPSDIFTNSPTIVCAGDENPDIIDVDIIPGVGQSTTYAVLDLNDNFLHVGINDRIDVENIPGTVNQIIVLKHDPNLLGLEVGNNLLDLDGCYSESNRITIQKKINIGGNLSIAGMDKTTYVACLGTSSTNFTLNIDGNSGENNLFIMTTPSGKITKLTDSPHFDFSELNSGNALIWHISYNTGTEGINMGENILQINGCHALSNPVEVLIEDINGGIIKTTTDQTVVEICGGEGINDLLEVTLTDVVGFNRTWIVTTPAGNILDMPTGPIFNFEDNSTGVYYLYNLTMGTDFAGLEIGNNVSKFEGCYDLSNRIVIRNRKADGGNLNIVGEGTFYEACISENQSEMIAFQLNNISGASHNYVSTNTNGDILDIFSTPSLNINDLSEGLCRIYNISYFGLVNGLESGGSINELSGCYNLSNYVTIRKNEPFGGLLTDDEDKSTARLCVGDDYNQLVNIRLSGLNGPNQDWIIADQSGEILSIALNPPFNVEGLGGSQLNIYSIAYENGLNGLTSGLNIGELQGCYNLSNPLVLTKDYVKAADLLTTENGNTETTMCTDDDIPDLLIMKAEGEIFGDNSHLIIVDPTGIIEDANEVGNIDFTDYDDGQSLVYQISYKNGLQGLNEGAKLDELSGCYDLSNPLIINRVSKSACLVNTIEINNQTIKFEINPNPTNNYIYLNHKGFLNKFNINLEIFDQTGKRLMLLNDFKLQKEVTSIDITSLPSGMYYCKITVDQEITTLKFVKK